MKWKSKAWKEKGKLQRQSFQFAIIKVGNKKGKKVSGNEMVKNKIGPKEKLNEITYRREMFFNLS